MRTAIFYITSGGKILADELQKIFPDADIFDSLQNLQDEFKKYDALIFIMAVGIVVRKISTLIENKLVDPAVVVVDERGRNVISLLSGHVGGANDLTRLIAEKIGANPVITTATDIEEKISIDSVSNDLGLRLHPRDSIKKINSAILHGEKIRVLVDEDLPTILVTDRFFENSQRVLILSPRRLIAGIGCRRGVTRDQILSALKQSCELIGQPIERIDLLASVDIKRDEAGILETARFLDRDIKFFDIETLKKIIDRYSLNESEFVKKSIGVGNICESSALACVGNARFALTKKIFDKVTVALIWEK